MVTGMSRNQRDAEARKRHRADKIARVQRERDIAEVFGVITIADIAHDAALYLHLPFQFTPVISCDLASYLPTDGKAIEPQRLFDGLTFPFKRFWISAKTKGGNISGAFIELTEEHGEDAYLSVYVFTNQYVVGQLSCFYSYDSEGNLFTSHTHQIWTTAEADENFRVDGIGMLSSECEQVVSTIMHVVSNLLRTLIANNIELVDQPPNPRLSAISEREFGRPLTTYKVLKVNTSHKQYRGVAQETGLQDFDPRRMHVVRGHHAEYGTNGRGLHFGKYERKIWIPAHVRGNEELGIVVKDYEVVAGNN